MAKYVVVKHTTDDVKPAKITAFNSAEERRTDFIITLHSEFIRDSHQYMESQIGTKISELRVVPYYLDSLEFINNPNALLSPVIISEMEPHLDRRALRDAQAAYQEIEEKGFWFNDANNDVYTFVSI